MTWLFLIVSFAASAVGAICGIGGGIVIKPVLDATGALPVADINFLSGCTVLAMSCYSVVRSYIAKTLPVSAATGVPLAIGAAGGGLLGKVLFSAVQNNLPDPELAGSVQAVILLIITVGTFIYTLKKSSITSKRITGAIPCILCGLTLGVMSSFLGIGGGPINLVVLMYFFSMGTKEAVANSLFIILLSQFANTALIVTTSDLSGISIPLVAGMAIAGLLGGAVGHKVNARIDDKQVDKLFLGLLVVIMGICCFNIFAG